MSYRYGTYTVEVYPSGYPRFSLESLEELEGEADRLLEDLNYVQACEKYYKVAEEIVKILSEKFSPEIMKKVSRRVEEGRTPWTTLLLNRAVNEIVKNMGWKDTKLETFFRDGWRAAVTLHREGYHESELTESDIINEVRKVKDMIALTKTVLKNCEDLFLRTTSTADREIERFSKLLEKLRRPKGETV